MENQTVKEVMVPLADYATVNEEATLFEAVTALEKAQKTQKSIYPHRAVLILSKSGKVIGKLSKFDILKALEPKYKELEATDKMSRFGLSAEYLKTMLHQFDLWNKPLENLCQKTADMKVKNFYSVPEESEYIAFDASLDLAIHQLVMGCHQSLLVKENDDIVGILKLTDVFSEVCDMIKSCGI